MRNALRGHQGDPILINDGGADHAKYASQFGISGGTSGHPQVADQVRNGRPDSGGV